MKGRYIVFDVETPNARNDRMSAIGVAVVENGMIVDELSTVVNPETYFHPFNIALTGITPAMAEEGPDFSQLWADLEPVFSSGLLVAHNAPFDMGVLAKCLRAYCVDWKSTVPYACTVHIDYIILHQIRQCTFTNFPSIVMRSTIEESKSRRVSVSPLWNPSLYA